MATIIKEDVDLYHRGFFYNQSRPEIWSKNWLYWLKLCREIQSRVVAMWKMECVGKWMA